MKKVNKKRGGHSFPKGVDEPYRRWIRQQACILSGNVVLGMISPDDQHIGFSLAFHHVCWGPVDPAHVGQHQATGAPDMGRLLPLCRAAHQFYDEHRLSFYRVTGIPPQTLAWEAARFAAEYQGQETGKAAPQ